jgi:hypothetical protein
MEIVFNLFERNRKRLTVSYHTIIGQVVSRGDAEEARRTQRPIPPPFPVGRELLHHLLLSVGYWIFVQAS